MKYIVANWKSHKTDKEVTEWFEEWKEAGVVSMRAEVVVAPAIVQIDLANQHKPEGVKLAVQDVSPFPFGAYTGAVAAEMIKGKVEYAIVGHSERRRYFHETDQEVANKVERLRETGITPIVCVDEPYAESQMAALENREGLVLAYEPLEAIGTGRPQEQEEVDKVVGMIRRIEPSLPILYGGSVNGDNAAVYLGVRGVDGLLVGGASLKVKELAQIVAVV